MGSFDDDADVRRALDLAAGPDAAPAWPAGDLARARAADQARSRRRGRVALGAAACLVAGGLGAAQVLPGLTDDGRSPVAERQETEPVRLVAAEMDAGPYTFELAPEGWTVQSRTPTSLVIARGEGSASDGAGGRLVIRFDRKPVTGEPITEDGRTIWVSGDSAHTVMAIRAAPGQPQGVVRVQYPKSTGWRLDTMIRFLRSVQVASTAEPSTS